MFYKHKQMADGHLNKCKTCAKKDVKRRYYEPDAIQRIAEYERKRFLTPERKAKVSEYQRRSRAKHPGKYKARQRVGNAIRDGRLVRLVCEICQSPKTEAHHVDYRKPFDVRWLCREHHLEAENKRTISNL